MLHWKKPILFILISLIAIFLLDIEFNGSIDSYQKRLEASVEKQRNKTQQSPDGAGEYFSKKRFTQTITTTPSSHYTQAIRAKRQYFLSQQKLAADPWQSLGPDFVGGRTRSLEFHPLDADIMFAAGVSGGVWKSIDAGNTWQAVSDDLENIAVVSLAIMPNAPDMLFAGTGEGVYVGRPIVRSRGVEGNGIYRSVDGGGSWQPLTFTLDNIDFRFVNKLRASQDGYLFAATEAGIWRSQDNGDNWTLVLDQRFRVGGCHEIEIQPSSNPNNLLVSCGSFNSAAVYRSGDNGSNWVSVIEDVDQGRTTLAFAPSNPDRVYALSAQNQFGQYPYGLNGLYRSDDGGVNWTKITDYNSANLNNRSILSTTNWVFDCSQTQQYQNGRLAGGGWYYNLITVDPTNHDRVWTGGLDLWRSDDGGQNFDLASFWWANENDISYIHGDHHLVKYHPNYDATTENRVYFTNDGGLWESTNSTASLASNNCNPQSSLVDWEPINNQYNVTQFYHGSVARNGQTLVGGTQDNGTQWRSASGNWVQINGGDGSYSAIDPKDPNTVYVSSQYGYLLRQTLNANGVVNFTDITDSFYQQTLFIAPFILDANDNNRLWLAGMSLWRSDDRGDSWTKASSDEYVMNYKDGLSALAVQPGNSNLVLMGGTDGHIYRHTNALSGSASSSMTKIKISDGYISSINFDINNSQKVVATVSTFGELHAWLSNDAGVTWQALDQAGSAGLPDLPAHDILVAPHDTNTLYVATDIGVYESKDNGTSWNPLTTGLPNVATEKIIYNRVNQESHLFAFTYGRGAFKSKLTGVTNFAPQSTQSNVSINIRKNENVDLNLAQYFYDQNDDLLTYSATNLAPGLSLSADGQLTGQATQSGSFSATIEANDGALSKTINLSINVANSSSGSGGALGMQLLLLLLISRLRANRLSTNRKDKNT